MWTNSQKRPVRIVGQALWWVAEALCLLFFFLYQLFLHRGGEHGHRDAVFLSEDDFLGELLDFGRSEGLVGFFVALNIVVVPADIVGDIAFPVGVFLLVIG